MLVQHLTNCAPIPRLHLNTLQLHPMCWLVCSKTKNLVWNKAQIAKWSTPARYETKLAATNSSTRLVSATASASRVLAPGASAPTAVHLQAWSPEEAQSARSPGKGWTVAARGEAARFSSPGCRRLPAGSGLLSRVWVTLLYGIADIHCNLWHWYHLSNSAGQSCIVVISTIRVMCIFSCICFTTRCSWFVDALNPTCYPDPDARTHAAYYASAVHQPGRCTAVDNTTCCATLRCSHARTTATSSLNNLWVTIKLIYATLMFISCFGFTPLFVYI